MGAALYSWRATRRLNWRSSLTVVLVCGILGAIALGALAGARRTETAYGRYLKSINASDVMVNIPLPNTSLIAKVSALPGIRSSAAWLGLAANPVVHGRVDDAFTIGGLAGSLNGEYFTQDTMTVLDGRLPRLDATKEIALTPGVARLLGVGVGGDVTYQFENATPITPVVTGYATYRVVGIVGQPPALTDQFDQVNGAVLPPAATAAALAHHSDLVQFSWVGLRLTHGSAGIPQLQSRLARLAMQLGGAGAAFDIRQLDTVHQQVQEAIRPQAVALALLGGLAALALLVLVGQGLAQLLDRSAVHLDALRALGFTRAERAAAAGLEGMFSVLAGMALAIAGAVALSPLAPVGPVRQYDPARGFQFDVTVLLGGGLVLLVVLLSVLAGLAWRSVSPTHAASERSTSKVADAAAAAGIPVVAAFGIRYATEAPRERRRSTARVNLVGSIAAVTAVVTAVVFGASLNGLVTHPDRYGWNWDVLIQSRGGYGNFRGLNLDKLMAAQPGVRGWSAFAFTQVPIDGQSIPVLGLDAPDGSVEPPTLVGHPPYGPDQIELGETSMRQLGKQIGDTVQVGRGANSRRMAIVGTVTLPSLGLQLTDHVSLGRGAVLPESALRAIENLNRNHGPIDESFSALSSTLAIDLDPGARAGPVVHRILAAIATGPYSQPGGTYQVDRVLGAAVANATQMGSQPLTLAVALAAAMLISLGATVLSGVRQRRRELAVLKVLGLTHGQVRAIVAWQTSAILLVAVALGLPLGLVAGRWTWANFAGSIGVLPITVVPVAAIVLGALALLIGGNALATAPAAIASRTPTPVALRAE
jgi:FtsX-like permease family